MSAVERFAERAERAASRVHRLAGWAEAADLARSLAGSEPVAVAPSLAERRPDLLAALGGGVVVPGDGDAASVADAAVGVVEGRLAVVETGSVLLDEGRRADRLVGLLCRALVQVVPQDAVVASLDDAAAWLAARPGAGYRVLVTGPSRTADIERSLTIGVQGPAEVHVAVVPGGPFPDSGRDPLRHAAASAPRPEAGAAAPVPAPAPARATTMPSWPQRYRAALADPNVASGLLGFQRAWRQARDAQVAELEAATGASFDQLRRRLAAVKDDVIAHPQAYLGRFREAAEASGARVVEVPTAAAANDEVVRLCRERGVRLVVKGKSMVSEEIGLNAALAAAGVTALETDLGEWLLQLAGDHPSHLVMPAIHKRRGQVAAILEAALRRPFDPDDVPAMVRSARTELRSAFLTAGMGVSGANALVADTGAVMLVTNEGNSGLVTTLPPVQVVVVGAEKLVPRPADAALQLRLLARSATGQPFTTYTAFVTGPSVGQELHVVVVDNGRSRLAEDPAVRPALRCIRCGACADVCPPYQVVGGHAFGHVYTGAIGLVVTPYHHGWEAAAGPQSLCVSCGACATVCPVDIPLPRQILAVRREVRERVGGPRWERPALHALASRPLVAAATRAAAVVTAPLRSGRFTRLPGWRTPPAVPWRPARSRFADDDPGAGRSVALFLQCVSDRLVPDVPVAAARLLRAAGLGVVVPRGQHCCGLPAFDAGHWDLARRMARQTLAALDGGDEASPGPGRDVVTAAPSCVVAMAHEYEQLFEDDPTTRARARRLAPRVHDLVSYLAGPARLPAGSLVGGDRRPVTVHRFCQSGTVLGHGEQMADLLRSLCGVEPRPLPEADVCCGFGGSTSLVRPEAARGVLDRKLGCIDDTGAEVVVTDNPGCLLHLRGGARASGRQLEVLHIAEYLAVRL